jgi:hypothetical protein
VSKPTHFVTIDLEDWRPGDHPSLTCEAPPEAMCHAVWTCDCEWWCKTGIENGRPWHAPGDYSEPEYERHVGTFDPAECNLKDWAENSDECLRGKVMLPVRVEFDYDAVLFHAAGKARLINGGAA